MNAMDILGGLLGGGSSVRQPRAGGGLEDLLGAGLGAGTSAPAQEAESSGGMSFGKKALIGVLGGVAVAALMKHMRNKGKPEAGASGIEMPDLESFDGTEHDANERATLLIRAMLNAAKSDGRVDAEEEKKILSELGTLGPDEEAFIRAELNAPVDAQALARSVPSGSEAEIYAMSLLGINLDNEREAAYLLELATALNLSGAQCNRIHRELGAPEIFDA